MTRSQSLANRLLQKSFYKMEARGFADAVNWLAVSLRYVRPGGAYEEQLNQLIEILVEIKGGPFHPIPLVERIESIENMIGSLMPALIRSVGQAHPSISPRLEALDWRLIFGIPLPQVDVNIIVPSDDDSGTGTISGSVEIESEDKSSKNGGNRPPPGPSSGAA